MEQSITLQKKDNKIWLLSLKLLSPVSTFPLTSL